MDRLTSLTLWRHANQYLKAALVLRDNEDGLFKPTYFCAAQAIELGLKAFLRGKGADLNFLKKNLSHDLSAALETAEKEGLGIHLSLTEKDRALIRAVNLYYETKDLQYTLVGFKSYPQVDEVIGTAQKIIHGTRHFCEKQRHFHDGKPTEVDPA